MPGTAIGTQMNQGFPGTYSRNGDCVIKNYLVTAADSAGPAFGNAVVLIPNNTGGTVTDAAVAVAAGHTPTMAPGVNYTFVGFAVREVLTQVSSYVPATPLTPLIQTYAPGQMCDVIERGSVTVVIANPSAAAVLAGGKVYLRIATGTGTVIGAIEPAADGGNTIQLTNCFFSTGVVDGNLVTEVVLLNRNTP